MTRRVDIDYSCQHINKVKDFIEELSGIGALEQSVEKKLLNAIETTRTINQDLRDLAEEYGAEADKFEDKIYDLEQEIKALEMTVEDLRYEIRQLN